MRIILVEVERECVLLYTNTYKMYKYISLNINVIVEYKCTPRLKKIIWVIGVLRRTVVSD